MCAQKISASRQSSEAVTGARGKSGPEQSALQKPEPESWHVSTQEYARPRHGDVATHNGAAQDPSRGKIAPHPLLLVQQYLGNQAVLRRLQFGSGPAAMAPQSSLQVNPPGDRSEQEADSVAEEVAGRGQDRVHPPSISSARHGIQRKCACGGTCDKCKEEQSKPVLLRTKSSGAHPTPTTAAAPAIHSVLQSPGQPLDAATRSYMEPRFGRDFSRVRLHTDQQAAATANALAANAYTFGQHIVFREGAFSPNSTAGRRLVAHELAHTVQQSGELAREPNHGSQNKTLRGETSALTPQSKLSVSEPDDPLEIEADVAADRVAQDRSPILSVPRNAARPSIQRQHHDKAKKAQTPRDFTVESDHGSTNSYLIFFPHYIEREDALRILFVHGTVPAGIELEYKGVMIQGWAYRLHANSSVIGIEPFQQFAPILQKHFQPDHLALTAEETKAYHERQEAFMDSRPVYLGGQTVREALTLEKCKDHLVPGQVGQACWGERAGFFYWVGFDSYHRGTTLEAKSSPKTPSVIADWEWFLSHSPADYVPHAQDLPYAATFDVSSRANFSLNQAERLEDELKDWELRQAVSAYATVFASIPGAVRNPTVPPPSTGAQLLKAGSTTIQAVEAWKVAFGSSQRELDMYLMALAGVLEHGMAFTGGGVKRPTPKPFSDGDPPHGPGATPAPAVQSSQEARQLPAARSSRTAAANDNASTQFPPDELAQRRAANLAKAQRLKAEAQAKITSGVAQKQGIRMAAGGGRADGGPTVTGSVESTVVAGSGGASRANAGGAARSAFPASTARNPSAVTRDLAEAGFTPGEIAAFGGEHASGLNAASASKVVTLGQHFTMDDLRVLARYLETTGNILSSDGADLLIKGVSPGDMEGFLARAAYGETVGARTKLVSNPKSVSRRLRIVGPEADLIGLGPTVVHLNPMTPEEMFEVLVTQRAFTFNRGGATEVDPRAVDPNNLPPGLGAGTGPAAGGRMAGQSVFAVVEIVDGDGRAVIRAGGQFLGSGDLHAEQSALAGLRTRLGGHAREINGGELKVVVDQLPCGPENANCSLALRQFANEYGLTLRVFVAERPAGRRANANAGPRASTMGSQTTGSTPVRMRELSAADLEHSHGGL